MRRIAVGLATCALLLAWWLATKAQNWNDELAIADPPITEQFRMLEDPKTPRLARKVVMILIDGLGVEESHLPYLDELRAKGASAVLRVPYPTISRPNYVTLLTGVPPRDSGVRANRVDTPVHLDTIMDRALAAGLRVVAASDFGNLVSLFAKHTDTMRFPTVETGDRIAPVAPVTWPASDVRRAPSLEALGPLLAEIDANFVPTLVLDVDRAGHAHGVGAEYRAAARDVDAMLRVAFAHFDWTHDAVAITADHGHVAPGGHGGTELEVSRVPLILAGAGVVPAAHESEGDSMDVAPTIAALLGVPAPGHAEGHALTELLALDVDAAGARLDLDEARTREMHRAAAVHDNGFGWPWVLVAFGGAALAGWLAWHDRHVGLLAGLVGFAGMFGVMVALTRGEMSPSYVPSLATTTKYGALGAAASIALQLAAQFLAVRRGTNWFAVNLVGLFVALSALGFVRAAFAPPFYDVPSPFWMVAIPTLELAVAVSALASGISLLALAVRGMRTRK